MMEFIWWLFVPFWLFWCFSWWLAHHMKFLRYWVFVNVLMGVVLWASLTPRAPDLEWLRPLWFGALLAVPCWWLVMSLVGLSRSPSPREDYSDLKPILDEHGKPRGL